MPLALAPAKAVADAAVTLCCCAVGGNWHDDFDICYRRGIWGSKSATARHMRHEGVFANIHPGQLGIAVYGFHWSDPSHPPLNKGGVAFGPRAPREAFAQAVFTDYFLFEVEAVPYVSTTPVWSDSDPDPWDLRVPINPLCRVSGVELAMADVNPPVAEGLRMSGAYQSMPFLIVDSKVRPTASTPAASPPPLSPRASDALNHTFRRVEASVLRDYLLSQNTPPRCAFCGLWGADDDLQVAHLKARASCTEAERWDPNVAVLACRACHHLFDSGVIFVDDVGVTRVHQPAATSEWRRDRSHGLDGRPFPSFSSENRCYLAWHRTSLGLP